MATCQGVRRLRMIFSSFNNGLSRRLIPQSCSSLEGNFIKVLFDHSSFALYGKKVGNNKKYPFLF